MNSERLNLVTAAGLTAQVWREDGLRLLFASLPPKVLKILFARRGAGDITSSCTFLVESIRYELKPQEIGSVEIRREALSGYEFVLLSNVKLSSLMHDDRARSFYREKAEIVFKTKFSNFSNVRCCLCR
ncbi:hypothetical protein DUI87_14311 [Hirundo rustica rustica]|uniref:Uncharacterized protein n=1 Tax=Hirundo rustica rustica TaxID=333673 RepID=A0A3M0K7Y0_HIRRU|nr:hypothetical protein DUI87_14311 [Hirundo rustica rustica]